MVEQPIKNFFMHCTPWKALPDDFKETCPKFEVQLTTETTMYPGLAKGLNAQLKAFQCNQFEARITDNHPDTIARGSPNSKDENLLKPDLIIAPNTRDVRELLDVTKKRKKRSNVGKGISAGTNPKSDVFGPIATPSTASASSPSTSVPHISPNAQTRQSARVRDRNLTGASMLPTASAHHQSNPSAPAERNDASESDESNSWIARMSWAHAEIAIEVKEPEPKFPFDEKYFDTDVDGRVQSRGQLIEYASELFRRGHREFVYTITFCKELARFQRFDRAAVVVSESFNYIERPEIIGEFLYRLFHDSVPRQNRGHDCTAEFASDSESDFFRRIATPTFPEAHKLKSDHVVAAFAKAATPGWPIHCLSVTAPWSKGDLPAHEKDEGTKSFVGWNLTDRSPVFVKDSWRYDSPGLTPEYKLYYTLRRPEVSMLTAHVPTMVAGDDVHRSGGHRQVTLNQNLVDVPSEDRLLEMVHTRLVFKEICRSLESFEDDGVLAQAMFDVVLGHCRAWKDFGILHRDISAGNILLYEHDSDGGSTSNEAGANKNVPKKPFTTTIGLLSDWDLAKTKDQLSQSRPTQLYRSGTWQFMSAALQQIPGKRHEVSDDLESLVQLLRWCGLKYFPHYWSDDPVQLRTILEIFDFHAEDPVTGFSKGHREKLDLIREGRCGIQGLDPKQPFAILLDKLSGLFRQHYELLGFNASHPCPSTKETDIQLSYTAQRAAAQFKAHFPSGVPVLPAFLPATPAITITDISQAAAEHSGSMNPTGDASARYTIPTKVNLTPKESPLYDHEQFMVAMYDIVWHPRYGAKWGKLVKNVKQASSFTRETASAAGSKHSLDISLYGSRKKARTTTDSDSGSHYQEVFNIKPGFSSPPQISLDTDTDLLAGQEEVEED
ncbi:hypothetical protein C8Q74DRAFT_1370372 [Fomes fomentarius]|nr:hypothetical protein C8Q74DRAFT_1370372 [Fomes fomentarius]